MLSLMRVPCVGPLTLLFWTEQPLNPLGQGISLRPLNLPIVGRAVLPVEAHRHLGQVHEAVA